MVKFILKRIGTMIIAMFMIILITFTLMHSIPGGPFTNTKGVPEEVTQAMEAKYGLDQPMPVQFVKYLGSLLHGDFGPSYKYTGKTVNDFIATGAPVSAKLGLVTLVFVLLTSIPMGILAALKNGKWQDMLLMAIATIGVTIPSFVIASMLIYDCFRQPVLQGCEGRLMRCTIETRDFGTMVFTLYPEYAPLTVANFVKTARSGFYDGLCWCRIVKDYVIQGGSPDNDIMTDSDWHIKGEFTENGVNNPLKHIRGALSMARDDDFDTAGTQFFVVHKDAAKLDGRYAAFGEMESGFDVLDAIANQPTYGPETWNKPKQMPVITKITIED